MANGSRRRRVGNIRKLPSGKWLCEVSCGVTSDGGRRRQSKTFDSEAEAERWAFAQAALMSGRPDLGRGVTLADAWALYEESRLPQLAGKTAVTYRWYMSGTTSAKGKTDTASAKGKSKASKHVPWIDALGKLDVASIDASDVQRHLDTMSCEKAKHAKASISAVLTWCVSVGILAKNPLVGHRFRYAKREEPNYDDDPFAAIEGVRQVWGVTEVLDCFERIRGLPLEPCWLACAGAGLRVEEALALRGMDVRRIAVGEREVTQLAIHAARTDADERKTTKTRQSVRIVAMMEPLGERYWELAQAVGRDELVCKLSATRQNKAWRSYFAERSKSKHAPRKEGCNNLGRLRNLPYVPLSKMRNTHVTLMQAAGVPDTLNALMHGHSESVERRHYMRPDHVAVATGAALQLVS